MHRFVLLLGALMASPLFLSSQMKADGNWPPVVSWLDAVEQAGLEEEEGASRYRDANRYIVEGQWSEAEAILRDLLAEDEQNRNLAYKLALCLQGQKGKVQEAVPLIQMAAQGDFARRYNAFDIGQRLPSEEVLEVGLEILQQAGHFAEASAMAQRIRERYPDRDYRHAMATQALKDCAFAMECVANPRDMGIRSERVLNSLARDFAPVITPDGSALYFTSYRNQPGDPDKRKGRIFRSDRSGSGWAEPIEMSLGTESEDITTIGVLGDDEALLVHRGKRNEGDIWTVQRDGEGNLTWKDKVPEPIASKYWETAMTERFDGQERIFVSDRPGGRGGRDLYRTVRLPNGDWSRPLNLGARINTPGEEESPVLSADGRTLVFSSTGHQGMGGYDLFRCIRLDNGSWSEPEHMGHPLNTAGDEVMVTLDASGQTGYLSSSRTGGGDLDIFSVEVYDEPEEALAVFIGEVLQWEDGDVLEVKSSDRGEPIFRVFRARPESGSFVAALPACREYTFTWMRGSEVLQSRKETVACDAAYGKHRQIGRLAPFGWSSLNSGDRTETEGAPREAMAAADMEAPEVVEQPGMVPPKAAGSEPDVEEESVKVAPAPSHAFDEKEEVESEVTPVTMVEFEAVESVVEFGYGRYLTRSTDNQVLEMVREIQARRAVGEVPVLEIEGAASFVPVKNKAAYKSNEQLAKMRAEKARDAIIAALSAQGLEVGVDFMIVLDWGVAGPRYQGDATVKQAEYRNFQYAKFSLARQLVEQR